MGTFPWPIMVVMGILVVMGIINSSRSGWRHLRVNANVDSIRCTELICCFLWNILGALDLAYLIGLFYWFHYTRQTKSNASKVFQIKHAIYILVCTEQIPVRPSQIDQIQQDGIVSLCYNELPWDILLLMRYCMIPFPHQYLWGSQQQWHCVPLLLTHIILSNEIYKYPKSNLENNWSDVTMFQLSDNDGWEQSQCEENSVCVCACSTLILMGWNVDCLYLWVTVDEPDWSVWQSNTYCSHLDQLSLSKSDWLTCFGETNRLTELRARELVGEPQMHTQWLSFLQFLSLEYCTFACTNANTHTMLCGNGNLLTNKPCGNWRRIIKCLESGQIWTH